MQKLIEICTSPAFGFCVKLLAGIAAVGFGLMGVGAQTRNDDDSLTTKGWVALVGIVVSGALALASVTYDYFVGQRAAKADAQKSQRLLLSVQRGIYPLRGITADFAVKMVRDFTGLAEYKAQVRKKVSSNRTCQRTSDFSCDEDPDEKTTYVIPSSSSLFPKTGSEFRKVIDNISLEVLIFRKTAPDSGKIEYKRLGSFNVDLGRKAPDDWNLEYDYNSDSLFLNATGYRVPDDAPIGSHVYSIVDFVPGLIAVGNSRTWTKTCSQAGGCDFQQFIKFMSDLRSGLEIATATLSFDYPKQFSLNKYSSPFGDVAAMECRNNDGNYLVLKTPDDIDSQAGAESRQSRLNPPSLSVNPASISATEKQRICGAVLTPAPDDLPQK